MQPNMRPALYSTSSMGDVSPRPFRSSPLAGPSVSFSPDTKFDSQTTTVEPRRRFSSYAGLNSDAHSIDQSRRHAVAAHDGFQVLSRPSSPMDSEKPIRPSAANARRHSSFYPSPSINDHTIGQAQRTGTSTIPAAGRHHPRHRAVTLSRPSSSESYHNHKHHSQQAAWTNTSKNTPRPSSAPSPTSSKPPVSLLASRDPSANWMSASPSYAITPKFSRLSLRAEGVILPVSSKEYNKSLSRSSSRASSVASSSAHTPPPSSSLRVPSSENVTAMISKRLTPTPSLHSVIEDAQLEGSLYTNNTSPTSTLSRKTSASGASLIGSSIAPTVSEGEKEESSHSVSSVGSVGVIVEEPGLEFQEVAGTSTTNHEQQQQQHHSNVASLPRLPEATASPEKKTRRDTKKLRRLSTLLQPLVQIGVDNSNSKAATAGVVDSETTAAYVVPVVTYTNDSPRNTKVTTVGGDTVSSSWRGVSGSGKTPSSKSTSHSTTTTASSVSSSFKKFWKSLLVGPARS